MDIFWLFCVSFLAATVLPMGSEVHTLALLNQGVSIIAVLLMATAGNTLGALFNWWLGLKAGSSQTAGRVLQKIHPGIAPNGKAARVLLRYGQWSVLVAWLPLIGDAITVAAGFARMRFLPFLCLAALGKGARYYVLYLMWTAFV